MYRRYSSSVIISMCERPWSSAPRPFAGNIQTDMFGGASPAVVLATERRRAGLSQRELADRVGTSQATISAYESGRKEPSLRTFSRLLSALGARLTVEPAADRLHEPSPAELARAGRILEQVIGLAEQLPARHEAALRFPRLTVAHQ